MNPKNTSNRLRHADNKSQGIFIDNRLLLIAGVALALFVITSSVSAGNVLKGAYVYIQDVYFTGHNVSNIDQLNATNGTFTYIYAQDWSDVSITESQISDLAHTTDTSAATECAGTTTYYDGEGNCDDISSVYALAGYGDNWNKTYADTLYADISVVDTNTWNTTEEMQDACGTMAGTSLTYTDASNDLSVDDDFIKNSGGDTASGNYVFDDNVTVDYQLFEGGGDAVFGRFNGTCIIWQVNTTILEICP